MKFPAFLLLLAVLSCTEKKQPEPAPDTLALAENPVEESSAPAEAPPAALSDEEMLAEEMEYELQNSENTFPQNVNVEGDIVRFMEEGFNISSPLFESNAVEQFPAFLRENDISYELSKTEASKDPDDYESTDTYNYTFGNSAVTIAYNQVISATIYSPAFEWDGIKVGTSRQEFASRFPYLSDFTADDIFQLHIGSFSSGCYVQFNFEGDKIVMINYSVFVQDCS